MLKSNGSLSIGLRNVFNARILSRKIFSLQAELADIIGGYTTLYSKDLVKDAEAKFSENMKKLILPRLKKGILPQSFMIHIGKSVSSLLFR